MMRTRIGAFVLTLVISSLGLIGVTALLGTSDVPTVWAQTDPGVIHVAPSGEDVAGCGVEDVPCKTIQYAVDMAKDGDEIWIAAIDVGLGISLTTPYVGTGDSVIALDKSLTLRGGYVYVHFAGVATMWELGPIPAVVDGEKTRRVLSVGGDVAPTFQGLTLMNGKAERGGNVYAEDAALNFIATSILSGSAAYGGGLYLKNCRAAFDLTDVDPLKLLTDLNSLMLIQDNVATADGGGLYVEGGDPLFAGTLIQANHAEGKGGGVFVKESALRVAASLVLSNTASQGGGLYFDGPLTLLFDEVPLLLNTYIRHNRALHAGNGEGGGLYMYNAVVGMVNDVIADNQAVEGAGMYLYASSPQIFFNTVAQNLGNSGLYMTHQPAVLWPPSPLIPSLPNITNTIITSHTVGLYVDSSDLAFPLENRATLAGTLWWGNGDDVQGPGDVRQSSDVTGSPAFICTGAFPMCALPYHISTTAGASAALDQGVEIGFALAELDFLVDIDGQLRPSGAAYDIGVDEVPRADMSLAFVPQRSMRVARPGRTVTHTHWLVNAAPETASMQLYNITARSDEGWTVDVDPDSVSIGGQETETVHVFVTVPSDVTTNGMTDRTLLTATAQSGISPSDPQQQASAQDFTTIISATDVDLGIAKAANVSQMDPGGTVHYTLTMTATGTLREKVSVTLTDRVMPADAIAAWTLPHQCPDYSRVSGVMTCTLEIPKGTSHQPYNLGFDITTRDTYTGGLLFNHVALSADVPEINLLNNADQATVVVAACTPLTSLRLEGPEVGQMREDYAFDAEIGPSGATLPVLYDWRATGQRLTQVHTQGLTDTATFAWNEAGTQHITLTVSNLCSSGIRRTHTTDIMGQLYLPLILKY